MKNDVIFLIHKNNTQDADGFPISELIERKFFAEIESVKRSEYYAAASAKINVSLSATMNFADYDEYRKLYGKPTEVRFEGDVYKIIRTYRRKKENDIDLTLAEVE